jgi:hypothetical protein
LGEGLQDWVLLASRCSEGYSIKVLVEVLRLRGYAYLGNPRGTQCTLVSLVCPAHFLCQFTIPMPWRSSFLWSSSDDGGASLPRPPRDYETWAPRYPNWQGSYYTRKVDKKWFPSFFPTAKLTCWQLVILCRNAHARDHERWRCSSCSLSTMRRAAGKLKHLTKMLIFLLSLSLPRPWEVQMLVEVLRGATSSLACTACL